MSGHRGTSWQRAAAGIFRRASHNPGVAVPIIVAALMIMASLAVSKQVLSRLTETQAEHFRELTGAYLDGLSTAIHPYVVRRDAWESYDVLDRARTRYAGIDSLAVLVVLNDETVLASSDPLTYPLLSIAPNASRPAVTQAATLASAESIWVHRTLQSGSIQIGRIAALIDVRKLHGVRRDTLFALIVFNTALTLGFVTLGFLLVRRMMKPLLRLSDHLACSSDGRLEPIHTADLPPADTDVGRAYRHYNAVATAIGEREALLQRLAEEERRALIGRYASAMAHEVNNPLGGLFNAVQMIHRHGDDREQRLKAARLLERGLAGIHNVVRATLMTWRGEADGRELAAADIEDIRQLVSSEAIRRDLSLVWRVSPAESYAVPAQAFRQIALNLLLNACAASLPGGTVTFQVDRLGDSVVLLVRDEGAGLPASAQATLLGREIGRAGSAAGLGLWSVARLSQALGATIDIASPPGTAVTIVIPTNHSMREVKAVA